MALLCLSISVIQQTLVVIVFFYHLLAKKKNQLLSKLNIEGFTAKQFKLKKVDKKLFLKSFVIFNEDYSQQVFENHYSGIPPPDNLFTIKYTLRPTPIVLQVFRC